MKLMKYIFLILIGLFVLMFIPLPYYESKQLTCPFGPGPCPTPGWRFNPSIIQSLLLSNAKQNNSLIITPSPIPDTNNSKIICGGIAGILCPSGYTCKPEGNYPDAAGICENDFR